MKFYLHFHLGDPLIGLRQEDGSCWHENQKVAGSISASASLVRLTWPSTPYLCVCACVCFFCPLLLSCICFI